MLRYGYGLRVNSHKIYVIDDPKIAFKLPPQDKRFPIVQLYDPKKRHNTSRSVI